MSKIKNNRREIKPAADAELYNLPKDSIKEFIEKERRHDELARLHEVRGQKRMWQKIFLSCLFMNLIFVCFALLGAYYNG